ncbi:ATP12 family chaperone protein [Tropicibacter sp. Alg240-R139]|uniref:ATP12 family chaperone protein n=1 Tax=Tropicibacter sp. Alg240-R139 TaxID=2305991 RepID=UPI0013DF90E3|nr:ATP12 family protein [Tropicibacter sp. Alg240-R139]
MSECKPKRFWKDSTVVEVDGGFTVELDGRRVKTPAKAGLLVPTLEMAQAIAREWDAQVDAVDPATMPFTRSANAAVDKVRIQHAEVADMLAAYGDSDLLCYRASHPQELVLRQDQLWSPALDWAAETLGARLKPVSGVVHEPQSREVLSALSVQVHALGPFHLAAFHDLVGLSGSLILGFAAARNWREADEIWRISRLDELWQEEQWGVDEEATEQAEIKRQSFLHAKRFFDVSG